MKYPVFFGASISIVIIAITILVWSNFSSISQKNLPAAVTNLTGDVDQYGIAEINPTNGRTWFSNWSSAPITLSSGQRDTANNPEFIARGNGTVSIDGHGTAILSGSAPRMYVYDAAKSQKWNNVEVTVYGKRIAESAVNQSQGIVIGTRSEHQDATDTIPCLGRTYYARLLYDGRAVFQKEVVHGGVYSENKPSESNVINWGTSDGKMPIDEWIGMKFVVLTNSDNTSVTLQMYIDRTDGANGGTWQKVAEYVDNGNWAQIGSGIDVDTVCGYSANKVLLDPGTSVFIRNDYVLDAEYKKFSIREIKELVPVAPDTVSPTVPTGLKLDAKTTMSASLSWNASTDAVGVAKYNVYKDGVFVTASTGLSYTMTGLSPGTTYAFTVKALDAAGNTSLLSTPLSVATDAAAIPAPVISVIAVSLITQTDAKISWTTDTNTDAQVQYGTSTTYGKTSSIDSTLKTSHTQTVSQLTAATLYHYKVVSKNASGQTTSSGDHTFTTLANVVTVPQTIADTTAPTKPTLSLVSKTENTINISWSAATDAVGVTGYDVYRGSTLAATTAGRTYTANALSAGTAYTFSVKAHDAAGNVSTASNSLSVSTNTPPVVVVPDEIVPPVDVVVPQQSSGGGGGGSSSSSSSSQSTSEVVPENPVVQYVPPVSTNVPTNLVSPIQTNNTQLPPTLAPIDAAQKLASGSRGEDVSRVQAFLKLINLFPNTIDGRFGPLTVKAVKKFQLVNHVVASSRSGGYGLLGPITRKKMNEIYGVIYPGFVLFK